VQLVLGLDDSLRLRGGPGRKWTTCGAALVRPDVFHEVDATGTRVLLAFVDAESALGAALRETIESDISIVSENTVATWRRHLGNSQTIRDRVEPWVRRYLLAGRWNPKMHPAVRRTLKVIREEIGACGEFSLDRVAAIAGLSPSRFMHVFTASVGVPLRPYVLWLRLQFAVGELMRGSTITGAAHRAGFSDAAHLNRTLRRMMGMTPGQLAQRRSTVRATLGADEL
jgi:AraC-like DNA-binding protein